MKIIDMRKNDVKQLYVIPTIIVSRSRFGRRVFFVWLWWSIERNSKI